VENGSTDPETWRLYAALQCRDNVRVIRFDAPFNYSAVCNRGADAASGSLLLFLNNDIEVIDPGWLGELVRVVTLPGVGIAGTKLRYPDGILQHAGVGVGIHLYGLMFGRADEAAWGVFGSSNHTRNWLAVMGACQMVRREVFDCVGGMDEVYRIAHSDTALCLQAHRMGWRTAYTPFAALVHHEGSTRGRANPEDDMVQASRGLRRLGFTTDPYLHPGLSPLDPVPRLRTPGEPSCLEYLRDQIERILAAAPDPLQAFDPFHDGDAEHVVGLPRAMMLWPPQPAHLIRDRWSAARWVIGLLRSRADLRKRFPRALSAGAQGAFAQWLAGDGGRRIGVPGGAVAHIVDLFANDASARAYQVYFMREHVRSAFPLGLLPPGRGGLAAWLLRHHDEEGLRLEEIWWFILRCAEDPSGELARTYLLSPAWQKAHPFGLTVFGRDRFAAWVYEYFDLAMDAAWLEPATWPDVLAAADQIRLAYAGHDHWQQAHPRAFETTENAGALLTWLAGDAALSDAVRTWCAARAADGTAAALATSGVNPRSG